jgi:hypothetical protein
MANPLHLPGMLTLSNTSVQYAIQCDLHPNLLSNPVTGCLFIEPRSLGFSFLFFGGANPPPVISNQRSVARRRKTKGREWVSGYKQATPLGF